MDAKLIKTEVNYLLKNEEGVIIASTSLKNLGLALSLKNCKEIERGYDLEELADEVLKKHNWETFPSAIKVFKEGFKKALEILGDKKFSDGELENIIVKSWYKGAEESYKGLTIVSDDDVKELIQSVQQTEWDVWTKDEWIEYTQTP